MKAAEGVECGADKNSMNDAVAEKISEIEDKVPETVTVGPWTGKVDQAAVKDVMEVEKKFWKEDARVLEDLGVKLIAEPFERAQMIIAAGLGVILKPSREYLGALKALGPDPEKCNENAMLSCLWKLDSKNRRESMGPNLFSSQCAKDNGCEA